MIKLIASDIDGTLLKNGESKICSKTMKAISSFIENGGLFFAASGRPYHSLKRIFSEIEDKIGFISHNGAVITYKSNTIFSKAIDKSFAVEFANEFYNKDNKEYAQTEVAACGKLLEYYNAKTIDFENMLRRDFSNHIVSIKNFEEINEDIYKLFVFCKGGFANDFIESIPKGMRLADMGDEWREYSANGVNKGEALKIVQQTFGVTKSETAAFGDNYNDKEMLDQADYSYAMEKSKYDLFKIAKFVSCDVGNTINEILKNKY